MNHPSHWMKRLSQPSKIASILDWKKTANTVLAINFHKNRVGIAVASHPSRGVPCLELEPLRFDTTTVADGSGGGEMNHRRRRRRRKTIADAIDRQCLERFSEIVEEHKVCGVVVNWPVQRETGRMGAACGRVVFALEQIWERSIESPSSSSSSSSSVEAERPTADTGHKSTRAPGEGCSEQQDGGLLSRPFCLWDARRIDRGHPRKRVDAFGRCVSYGKNQEPRPSSSDSAPASRRSLSETTRPLLRSNVNSNNNNNNNNKMLANRSAVAHQKLQPLVRRALRGPPNGIRPMTVLSKQSGEEYKKQNYTERMNRTGRPVSPHVTIYALPVAAIASITTRVTGVMLSFGAFGIGAADLVVGPGSSLALMQTLGSSGLLIGSSAKLAVSFPLVYHSLGAFRHFVWDYFPDRFLNNVDVPKSSIALIGSSGIISLGLATLV